MEAARWTASPFSAGWSRRPLPLQATVLRRCSGWMIFWRGAFPAGWAAWSRLIPGALPPFVCELLRRSLPAFGKRLRGYDSPDAILTGVETRTSSPVRILRGEDLYSPSARGLIPCGEGAGYAGGIVSAAVDGIRAAERILGEYRPLRA